MEESLDYEKIELNISDLEAFRNSEGYIDLEKTDVTFSDASREYMGNTERTKNWMKFKDKSVLFKGETLLDGLRNYSMYSELIIEELAKQVGLPAAHYDLAKYGDNMGVISEKMISDDESLITLRDIIGDEIDPNDPDNPITSLQYVFDTLQSVLSRNNYSQEEIDNLILDFKKRTAFTLATLDQDKHTENFAFVQKSNGKLAIAPVYDSECSLLLDNDEETVSKLLNDYQNLSDAVRIAQPRIGVELSVADYGHGEIWSDTVEQLIEEDELYNYFYDEIIDKIDIDKALEAVEARIHARLPENVRQLAKYSYESRQTDLMQVLEGRYYSDAEKSYTGEPELTDEEPVHRESSITEAAKQPVLSANDLIAFFKSKEIRTSEQDQSYNSLAKAVDLQQSIDSKDQTSISERGEKDD